LTTSTTNSHNRRRKCPKFESENGENMINLRNIARRHGLPLDDRGAAIALEIGRDGRLVVWADQLGEGLALTFSAIDHGQWPPEVHRLLSARIGRMIHSGPNGATIAFPADRLSAVLAAMDSTPTPSSQVRRRREYANRR
jgi:hypothetical protein